MKNVRDMSISDIVHALRQDDDWYVKVADRIEELFEHENEGVVAISEAYQRLKEHHRWISFKERYPVGADGNKILVYNKYNGVFTIEQERIRDYSPTYWSHITSPEDKP